MKQRIIDIFRQPTLAQRRLHDLQQAEHALHEALMQKEYYEHIVSMFEERVARLRAALDNIAKESA